MDTSSMNSRQCLARRDWSGAILAYVSICEVIVVAVVAVVVVVVVVVVEA
jgi:hypothetical protein